MKLRILSDLHTEGFNFVYNRLDEDVLILAGDIGVGHNTIEFIKSLPKDLQIVFIAGNHEYYNNHFENINKWFKNEFMDTNVHFLNNSEWVYKGVRFLGGTMHSDFKLFGNTPFVESDCARGINDFYCIKTGNNRVWTTRDCKNEFSNFEVFMKYKLREDPFQGKTVVVSHFCPSIKSVPKQYLNINITPFFASNCGHLMGFSDLWVHGHTHTSFDYTLKGTRVVCNPCGYGGPLGENKDGFNPNLIVEI